MFIILLRIIYITLTFYINYNNNIIIIISFLINYLLILYSLFITIFSYRQTYIILCIMFYLFIILISFFLIFLNFFF